MSRKVEVMDTIAKMVATMASGMPINLSNTTF